VRALVFYAGPRSRDYAGKKTPEEVARIFGERGGPYGFLRHVSLSDGHEAEEHGIHDRRLWRLQELVALNIASMMAGVR
jgi:cation transport protein ChaC